MKGTLSSILTICPNHFNVATLIIFTMCTCSGSDTQRLEHEVHVYWQDKGTPLLYL
jgi:hypothetical protein